MKINLIKSTVFADRWRCGAVLLASVCLVWVTFISSSAQLKAQRHVSSIEMGQASEGVRVTVISDSPLNDYEAFRQGDRFYVKIPLAEFDFSQPRFHGNGFDDVQMQKVGDSVVVSFKLQPGANAHVDQHANRLEVIFSAPNRSQHSNTANAVAKRASSAPSQNPENQRNQDRQRDTAGPVPSDFTHASRERYANGPRSINEAQRGPARNANAESNLAGTSRSNNAPPLVSSTPLKVASPTPVPNYPAASSYTPATVTSTPISSTSSKPAGVSVNSLNANKVRDWLAANRKASLIGALVLAGLLVLLTAFLYRGRMTKTSAKRVKRPLAQPKYDSQVALDELPESRPEPGPVVTVPAKSEWSRVAPQTAFAPASEVAPTGRAAVLSKPSSSSVVVADNESVSEEREVFEL